jgi:hypothetical protein
MIDPVFKKIETLAYEVRKNLRKQGFVVPCDNGDGTVGVDNYTIVKENTGFYVIKDRHNNVIVDQINLPQTAAVLANNLALGKWLDDALLREDRRYGYGLFEETLSRAHALNSLKRKDIDRAELMYTRLKIARFKKTAAKKEILSSFEKLRRLR